MQKFYPARITGEKQLENRSSSPAWKRKVYSILRLGIQFLGFRFNSSPSAVFDRNPSAFSNPNWVFRLASQLLDVVSHTAIWSGSSILYLDLETPPPIVDLSNTTRSFVGSCYFDEGAYPQVHFCTGLNNRLAGSHCLYFIAYESHRGSCYWGHSISSAQHIADSYFTVKKAMTVSEMINSHQTSKPHDQRSLLYHALCRIDASVMTRLTCVLVQWRL